MKSTEFYFIRHGETDPHDNNLHIVLNANGEFQAHETRRLVSKMHFSSVHHSPLVRATQTKDILFKNANIRSYSLNDLSECTGNEWNVMTKNHQIKCRDTEKFIMRAIKGVNSALSKPGLTLIVAHGGIHYAFCKYHNIQNHPWLIGNCALVHFKKESAVWAGQILP